MNPVETIVPPNVHVIAGKTATGSTSIVCPRPYFRNKTGL
jgi:hypothetical protein